MDPDECLKEIRDIITRLNAADDRDDYEGFAADLAEHVEALDEWLSKGGFLPKEWTQARIVTAFDGFHLVELSLQDSSPFPGAGVITIIDDKETT